MRTLDQHEAWEMKPRKLTPEEVERPEMVIEELFEYATLPELRWQLWEGTKAMITGTFNSMKGKERCRLLFFFEQIERLIEVTHVMHEARKVKSLA
jgi:hypothetical protein